MQVTADLGHTAPRGQLATIALTLLSLILGAMLPLQAHAAINNDIEVSSLTLSKSDRNGNDSPGAITTQDVAKLSYTWDASKATINPGDSFSIDLGEYFKNLENPKTVSMSLPYNGTTTEVGTCALTEKTIECTFNNKIEDLKKAGFTEFKGSSEALLLITRTTTAETVDMTVNGSQKVSVDLPGTGGIAGPPPAVYTPYKFTKVSSVITSTSSSMVWEVNFGSDYIKEQLAGGAGSITVDGKTRQTITITDTLGPGMTFNSDPSRWNFSLRNSAAEPDISGATLTNAAGRDLSTEYGDFDMTVDIQGQVATIEVTGPFAPQSNYKISYPVTFTSNNGKATVGVRYTNSASLNSSGAQGEFTRSYTDSFKVNVEMAAGFGGFEIVKMLGGSGLDAVDVASTTLPVKVDYVLPGPASSYTGWQAPGTLNDDGRTGTAILNVSIGKTNTFQGTFPQGTVVTLSEDTGQASPAPSGYTWGDPVFTVGNTETNVLTIGNRVSTKVTLNNTADVVKEPGTFQVTKTVVGAPASARDKEFTFTYTCSDGQSGQVSAKGDATAVQAGATFPQGTTCTVREDVDSAQLDGYTLTVPEEQTVTVKDPAETVATVAFVNSYTRDTGAFSIAKSVQGGPDGAANSTFTFTYTCDGEVKGTLAVPGDGTAVSSPQIPAGASCTITEDAASAAKDGYSLISSLSQDTVTIAKDQTAAITATNTYTRDTGTFSVTKSVKGDYVPPAGDSVKVGYTCNDPDSTQGSLDVPMDGTAVGGPALPTGTVCTLSEDGASAQREGYSVATAYSSTTVRIVKDQVPDVSVTNTYTRQTGGFSVSKTVQGDGAQSAPAEFTFEYTCTGEPSGPKQVVVRAGETAHVDNVPTGSCTLTEKDASTKATSLSTTLAVNGTPVQGDEATFDVLGGDAAAVSISAVNTYTLNRGAFTVSKKVEGDGAESHKSLAFTFQYACTSDAEGEVSGELTVHGDGTAVSGPALPVGATCSVSEKASSAQVNGYDVKIPETQEAIVEEGKDAALSFTNTYSRQTGSFSVTKTVTGAQTGDKQFTFAYTCTDGTEGALKVKADGEAVTGPKVPTGTQCTVTEDAKAAAIDGYTLAAPEARTVTVSEKDQVVDASFVNVYTETPSAPAPSASPTPSASGDPAQGDSGSFLARTGALVGIPLALALVAIAGGVLLAYRRRA